jgi:hypothetical protein
VGFPTAPACGDSIHERALAGLLRSQPAMRLPFSRTASLIVECLGMWVTRPHLDHRAQLGSFSGARLRRSLRISG